MKYDIFPTWQEKVLDLIKQHRMAEAAHYTKDTTGWSATRSLNYVEGMKAAHKIIAHQVQDLEDYAAELSSQTVYSLSKHTRYEGSDLLSIWTDKSMAEEEAQNHEMDLEKDQNMVIRKFVLNRSDNGGVPTE